MVVYARLGPKKHWKVFEAKFTDGERFDSFLSSAYICVLHFEEYVPYIFVLHLGSIRYICVIGRYGVVLMYPHLSDVALSDIPVEKMQPLASHRLATPPI